MVLSLLLLASGAAAQTVTMEKTWRDYKNEFVYGKMTWDLGQSRGVSCGLIAVPSDVSGAVRVSDEMLDERKEWTSVSNICPGVFKDRTGMTSITLPKGIGLGEIDHTAFEGCTGLTELVVDGKIDLYNGFDLRAFDCCPNLTEVIVEDSGSPSYPDVKDGLLVIRGAKMYGGGYEIYWCPPGKKTGALTLSNYFDTSDNTTAILRIHDYAFAGAPGLTSIKLPKFVSYIGKGAFEGCSGLTSITMPEEDTYISDNAFEGCSSLTSIDLSRVRGDIADNTFASCSSLTTIELPTTVTRIGKSAFADCTGFTSITLPDGVAEIADNTFAGCSGLTSITLPEGVTKIGEGAFADCSGLTSITLPKSLTEIGCGAFKGCSKLTAFTVAPGNTKFKATQDGMLLGWDHKTKDITALALYPPASRATTRCRQRSPALTTVPSSAARS